MKQFNLKKALLGGYTFSEIYSFNLHAFLGMVIPRYIFEGLLLNSSFLETTGINTHSLNNSIYYFTWGIPHLFAALLILLRNKEGWKTALIVSLFHSLVWLYKIFTGYQPTTFQVMILILLFIDIFISIKYRQNNLRKTAI